MERVNQTAARVRGGVESVPAPAEGHLPSPLARRSLTSRGRTGRWPRAKPVISGVGAWVVEAFADESWRTGAGVAPQILRWAWAVFQAWYSAGMHVEQGR